MSSMQSYSGGGGPAWKVIETSPTTGPSSSGGYVPGYKVTYQLKSGPVGVLFIPKAGLTPDALTAAINADAATLDGIAGLSSGM